MKLAPTIFFRTYSKYAENSQIKHGVPSSITLAQAALESGWGGSGLTDKANNFFGIKADTSHKGSSVNADTLEYINGIPTRVNAPFRSYSSPQGSFDDHATFLKVNKRYKSLFELPITDYKGWANGLQAAGYATDPSYASKLIVMVEKYGLTMYDREAETKKKFLSGQRPSL